MSFFTKARGILNTPVSELFKKDSTAPKKITVPFEHKPSNLFMASLRGPKPRRSDKRGRGLRYPNGARRTVRWPANGVKP